MLDFKVSKRGSDFLLYTGISLSVLQNYENEFRCLTSFKHDSDDLFIIPRNKLVEVLDVCFDHFTEDSLLSITKLLDKNDAEMKERIVERSASKRRSMREKVHIDEKISVEQQLQLDRERWEKEQRERWEKDQLERREQWEKEQREKLERAEFEKREREKREKIEKVERSSLERERKQKVNNQDLNYSDPVFKVEILKMIQSIRQQVDTLEKYVEHL